jgi:tetratricopeptide (TPR) repeat protein
MFIRLNGLTTETRKGQKGECMTSAIKIFCCYARKDKEFLNKLKIHLRPLQRHGLIHLQSDGDINAGDVWEEKIHHYLQSAQIILLLISPDFINSDYCYDIEMQRALERHHRGDAKVIPIILRPVHWQSTPLGKLQALPTDAKPVTDPSWRNQDQALFNIAEGIRHVVEASTETTLPAALTLPQKSKETWANEGFALYNSKRYEEALAAYDQAIHLDPNFAIAYTGKGFVLDKLKRYEEALAAFNQTTRLDPYDVFAYINKGVALITLNRHEKALVIFEQAIRLDPSEALAYTSKGLALNGLKRYKEALAVFDQAIRLDPYDASAYTSKGLALNDLKRYKEALAVFDQAIHLDPNDAFAYAGKSNALFKFKRYKEALAASEQAIRLDSSYALAYYNKGTALFMLKRYEEALWSEPIFPDT